jgi:hypothetical protein
MESAFSNQGSWANKKLNKEREMIRLKNFFMKAAVDGY